MLTENQVSTAFALQTFMVIHVVKVSACGVHICSASTCIAVILLL